MADEVEDQEAQFRQMLAWHLSTMLGHFDEGVAYITIFVRMVRKDEKGELYSPAIMVGNDDPESVLKMVAKFEQDKNGDISTEWLDPNGKPARIQ
jgi:hypothetical protein